MSTLNNELPSEEEASSEATSGWIKTAKIVVLSLVTWCALGVLVYPQWWYDLIFAGQFRSAAYWGTGNFYGIYNTLYYFLPALLTIWAILSFSGTAASPAVQTFNRKLGKVVNSSKWFVIVLVALILAFGIGLYCAGPRTQQLRDTLASLDKSRRDLDESLAKIKTNDALPLSEPTSFAYIDKNEVESLYGQNEPELIPTLVKKKVEASRKGDVSVSAGDYLKTDAGLSQVRSEEQELRATEKNPQRKLKDLIDFLYEQKKLKRYGFDQPRSDDLKKLDDATSLLSRYGVIANESKLRTVRDRLFSEDVNRLENELSTLHGLVLVDGDWTVERSSNGYLFRAPVIEHISNPLSFEFRLNDEDLQGKTHEIIETLKSRPIRLTAFGNVIAGISIKDRNVHIVPIAVY